MVNEIDKSNLEYADKPINSIFLKNDIYYYNEKDEKEDSYKKGTIIYYVDHIDYSTKYFINVYIHDFLKKEWVNKKFKKYDWLDYVVKNNTQLSLDKNALTFIREIIPRKNMEFECRFGTKNNKFLPNIGKDQFSSILLFLKEQSFLEYKFEQSTVKIYDNNVREITYKNNEKKYEMKRRLKYHDTDYSDFTLRFAISEENRVSRSDRGYDIVETRERTRHIFRNNNLYEYALTKVTNKDTKSEYYELEIEYNLESSLTIENIIFSIQNVLKFLILDVDNPIYIPISEQKYVRYIFKENEIIETKPINLPRHIAQDLYSLDYTVTNKLDGERFYIYFSLEGLYAINRRKVRKLTNEIYTRMAVSIFDAEYFNGVYYIFDCLMIQGESLIHTKEHYDRIKIANIFSESFRSFMPEVFKVKKFERMDKNQDAMKYYSEKILKEDRKNNDGLIFTPSDFLTDMSPIYKWKYPEKMSIDFMVHKIYKKDNINTYDLNVKGEGGRLYPYIIDDITPAIYETSEELKERGIYEFTYDLEDKKFKLLRERTDKTDPNYITVADNVWQDMKNPFTEKELLDLLLPPPLRTYRLYQNNIKKELINKYCKNASVLDLGSGRGGDLGKYDKANVDQLWCVEPYDKNYNELLSRLEERKNMISKTKLIIATAQETDKIVNNIRDTYNIVDMTNLIEEKPISKDYKDWFPIKKGIDRTKLKINEEGLYSMTKSSDSELIINAMKRVIGESLSGYSITDGTANMGGDSIRFAMNFKSVNSVELNKDNYEILKNNLDVYNFQNVNVYNKDITSFWKDLTKTTDVLFVDPPWGGRDYKKEEKINLFLGDNSLNNFLGREILLNPNRPYYIFLKVPFNYNIDFIKDLPNVYDVQIFKIRKFYLICLAVDNKEMPLKKANIISSFMSLSFFFDKDEQGNYKDLDMLVNTISKTLQNGGHFIGTTIDGKETLSMLKYLPDNKLEYESGYIRLLDYERDGENCKVEIKMEEGIVDVQQEYLVNFDELVKRLSLKNINLVSSTFFNNPSKKNKQLYSLLSQNESEEKLNSLYRSFVFVKNKPEELIYTKAIKRLTKDSEKQDIFAKISLDSYRPDIKFEENEDDNEEIRNKCLELFYKMCSNYSNYSKQNYTFDFEYIDENQKYKKYHLHGKVNHLNVQLESYNNGKKLDKMKLINIAKTFAIIKLDSKTKNSLLITEKVKNKVDFSDIFYGEYKKIVSCLYQLYFTIYCMLENGIYPVDPMIEIEINPSIKSIKYQYGLGSIDVIDGYIVKVSNFAPSTKYRYKSVYMIDNPNDLSIEYIDIITKLPDPFKRFIYNQLNKGYLNRPLSPDYKPDNSGHVNDLDLEDLENKEFHKNFYLEMLDYDILYDTKKMIKIRLDKNSENSFRVEKYLSIKDDIEKDNNRLDLLDDDSYKYYQKVQKYFKIEGNPIEEIVREYYPDNKRIMYVSDAKDNINLYNYNIVGKNPDIYILNSKSYNIPVKQNVKNIFDCLSNINNGNSFILKMTSYFSIIEMSLIGLLANSFETVDIVKPISSSMTKSEVFLVCNNYIKKIEVKDKINKKYENHYFDNSLSHIKYLQLLLSSYLIYGRQLYISDILYQSFLSLYSKDRSLDYVTRYNISATGSSKYFYRFVKKIQEHKVLEKRQTNGIKNIGNTCYMNSCLQSLANLEEIQKYFCDYSKVESETEIVSLFSKIVCELTQKKESPINTSLVRNFKKVIAKEYRQFRTGQHDAEELMYALLNLLHLALNKKDGKEIRYKYNDEIDKSKNIENVLEEYYSHNDSIISKLFTFLWKSTLECQDCKNKRSYVEPSFNYNYIINEKEKGKFKLESNVEILKGSNQVYCDVCHSKTDHSKTLKVIHYPKIMMITFVRFRGEVKNESFINFPFDLSLVNKNLNSVINHMGNTGGGHYTCFANNGLDDWYEYDDDTVTKIDKSKVVSNNAYILFYS